MAKDYDIEGMDREIQRKRPSRNPRCAALKELDEYEVADGYPDPRGWTVRAADGRDVGKVQDLIVDTGTMRTRYLAVRLDDYFTRARGVYDVLVPIGAARLDDDADNVIVNDLSAGQMSALPAYEPRSLTRDQEHEIRTHFTAGDAMSAGTIGPGATTGGDFYDHDHFDDRRFFSRGRERAREERHDDVSLDRPRTEVAEQLTLSTEPKGPNGETIIVRKEEGR